MLCFPHFPPTQKWVPWWGTCWPFTTSINQPRYLHRSVPLEGKVISKCFHWKHCNRSTFQLICPSANILSTSGHGCKKISTLTKMLIWREAVSTSLQDAEEEKKKGNINTSRLAGYKLMLRVVMYLLVLPASPVAWPDPSSNIHLLFMTRLHKLLLSQNQNQPSPCLHCSAVSVLFASPVSEGRTVCIIPWEVKHHTAHMHRCPAAPNHLNHFYPILRLSWRFHWLDCCIFSSELWIKLVHMQVRCSHS